LGWEPRLKPGTAIDRNMENKLKDALTISQKCKDPIRNAYELGVFTRDRAETSAVIKRALMNLGLMAGSDREAILPLREKYEQEKRLQNTSGTRPRDELDPGLWRYIMEKGPSPSPVRPGRKK